MCFHACVILLTRRFLVEAVAGGALVLTLAGRADVVSDWNATAADYLTQYAASHYQRGMTMVHVAQFDAINGAIGGYVPYALNAIAINASPEAAAAQAAYSVLTNISGANVATLNTALTRSLSAVADGAPKEDGIRLGRLASTCIIQLRASDNPDLSITPPTSTAIGKWRAVPPIFLPGVGANSRYMVAWTMRSQSEFRPSPPPAVNSAAYTRDWDETRLLGALNSTNRTLAQKQAAEFHAAPELAYLRPALAAKTLPLIETARAVALYYMASSDAATAFFEAQYAYSAWRPYTAILLADTDGNDATSSDPTWMPLLATPNHPEYPSGTCAFTTASIEILKHFYGDDFAFTATYNGAVRPRYFAKLSDVIDDAITGRIAAGAHFRYSCVAGVELGRKIAQNALDNFLRPAAHFSGLSRGPNGQLQLQLKSGSVVTHILESSSDLNSWTPRQTNAYGTVLYTETDAGAADRRFYRSVIQR